MKQGRIARVMGAWALALLALAPPARAGVTGGKLTAPVTLGAPGAPSGVKLALADLARDCRQALGGEAAVCDAQGCDIQVSIDPSLAGPEAWRIEVADKAVKIAGSDELGAIYGVYQFSRRFLGVDPFWFWKDQRLERREAVELKPQTLQSAPPTFRYRGWFVNDEDLLTEWKSGGGKRFIDYPFYFQVIHPDAADAIFETLLRAGGNLVIPASFVDVMNPPEAALVRRAAERGLYVTQHHIEPLGVSHFGFENFWKRRGRDLKMTYTSLPDEVRETWRAFAAKWRELAGDKVIWQLGLRGRGDRPVWSADKGVTRKDAGAVISRAMADQWRIVREVDPRPAPPATTTLWLEGSELMSEGSLIIPEDVTIVFADEGKSQAMQQDFHKTARTAKAGYGVYYHVGFWMQGPHLVQGTRPEKLKRVFDEVVAKGDTRYAIINVCNVREHVLGVQAAMEVMTDHASFSTARFMERFAPPALQPAYREFLASYMPLPNDCILQDGYLAGVSADLRRAIAAARKPAQPAAKKGPKTPTYAGFENKLQDSIARLDRVIQNYPADQLSAAEREFYDAHLLTQARTLRGLYAYTYHMLLAVRHPANANAELAEAEKALAGVIEQRKLAEQGKWTNWFRGDKKMNLPGWLEETRKLKEVQP